MGAYRINIVGLSDTVHHFQYEIGASFFAEYGTDLVSDGDFQVDVTLDKRQTFLEADFKIKGTAKLICDRSLDPFDYPVDNTRKIVFKYGDKDEEITDEIVIINRETAWLEIGQYIYEFIVLAMPIKRLHPRFQEDQDEDGDDSTGKIVYSSEPDKNDDNDNDEADPRWNILKKLK